MVAAVVVVVVVGEGSLGLGGAWWAGFKVVDKSRARLGLEGEEGGERWW